MQQLRTFLFLTMILAIATITACSSPQPAPPVTMAALATVPPPVNTEPTDPASEPPTAVPPTLPPTATAEPLPAPTNTPIPENIETPPPETAVFPNVNGIPVTDFVVLPPEVRQNVIAIFQEGQARGRSATTFSKLGDSTSLNPNFLGRFDDPANVNLGQYDYLQPTIDHFTGHFSRYGVSAKNGLHSWSVFDPLWADKKWCQANEDVLNCEFRLNNPSIIFVRLGSNDAGSPDGYRYNMKQVIETSIENGVIPVLVTKADRFEGEGNINNNILRELAIELSVPILEFDIVSETLPNRGLKPNDVHMEEMIAPHDFTMPETMQSGHAVHDLIALMMLDELRQIMVQAAN
ncbi:MAG: hypothetical protein CSB13_06720 [Chloroflexi bacterium]|nr:MAG: hypothetical protein CSB13_06720 [Chloroflexota bacterium]